MEEKEVTELTIPQVLAQTADLIDKAGLSHGYYRNVKGEYCVIGGINKVLFDDHCVPIGFQWDLQEKTISTLANRLEEELDEDYRGTGHSIFSKVSFGWSDAHTKEEIVSRLREIAAELTTE